MSRVDLLQEVVAEVEAASLDQVRRVQELMLVQGLHPGDGPVYLVFGQTSLLSGL